MLSDPRRSFLAVPLLDEIAVSLERAEVSDDWPLPWELKVFTPALDLVIMLQSPDDVRALIGGLEHALAHAAVKGRES